MKSTILLLLIALMTAGALADCSVDVKAEKDKCIGIMCSSSEQCISSNCIGVPNTTFFKCGGCNENDAATTFKCPGRYCNVT